MTYKDESVQALWLESDGRLYVALSTLEEMVRKIPNCGKEHINYLVDQVRMMNASRFK